MFLNSVDDLCAAIYSRISPSISDAHGLIIVSGATASGKSKIARGIIYKYLQTLVPNSKSPMRRPHLVTFEDPIDKLWADNPAEAKKTGIDYTPRELGADVESLDKAIQAALRQTPKIFFVGEIRRSQDWRHLLRFASTGHLAITTSHAGTLSEAMGQLFRAARASTPAARSEVASQLLALVHLRTHRFAKRVRLAKSLSDVTLSIAIPAIWVRSPVSTKTLMADGLSALLPYRDLLKWADQQGRAGELGCLGRTCFAEHLLGCAPASTRRNFRDEVRSTALSWDLEGL